MYVLVKLGGRFGHDVDCYTDRELSVVSCQVKDCAVCSEVFVGHLLHEEMKKKKQIKRRHKPVAVSP